MVTIIEQRKIDKLESERGELSAQYTDLVIERNEVMDRCSFQMGQIGDRVKAIDREIYRLKHPDTEQLTT